jgi:hypothetical protein
MPHKKYSRKNYLKGGFKKRNPLMRGFEPIKAMMLCPGTTFRELTDQSLKGFIFSMHLTDADCYQYLNIGNNANNDRGFYKPVNDYLMKFAILKEEDADDEDTEKSLEPYISIKDGETRRKATEGTDDFLNEAKLQHQIWTRSIKNGTSPVCPSAINISMFNKSNADILLNFMDKKAVGNVRAFKQVTSQLRKYISNNNYKLGLMTMEIVANPISFYEYVLNPPNGDTYSLNSRNKALQEEAIVYTVAQLVRLFIDCRVLHFDLHANNILVTQSSSTSKPEAFIIDFGRAAEITNLRGFLNAISHTSQYTPTTIKFVYNSLVTYIGKPELKLPGVAGTIVATKIDGGKAIQKIIAYLEDIDAKWIQEYTGDDDYEPQMSSLITMVELMERNGANAYERIYNKYVELTAPQTDFNEYKIEQSYATGEFERLLGYNINPDIAALEFNIKNTIRTAKRSRTSLYKEPSALSPSKRNKKTKKERSSSRTRTRTRTRSTKKTNSPWFKRARQEDDTAW